MALADTVGVYSPHVAARAMGADLGTHRYKKGRMRIAAARQVTRDVGVKKHRSVTNTVLEEIDAHEIQPCLVYEQVRYAGRFRMGH